MKRRQIIRDMIVLICTLLVTFIVGEWAIRYALSERSYKAVGGEYFLIPVVAWVAYKVINIFLDLLEDIDYCNNQMVSGSKYVIICYRRIYERSNKKWNVNLSISYHSVRKKE